MPNINEQLYPRIESPALAAVLEGVEWTPDTHRIWICNPHSGIETFWTGLTDNSTTSREPHTAGSFEFPEYAAWKHHGGHLLVDLSKINKHNNAILCDLIECDLSVEVEYVINSNTRLAIEIAALEISSGTRLADATSVNVSREIVQQVQYEVIAQAGVMMAWQGVYPGNLTDLSVLWGDKAVPWPHDTWSDTNPMDDTTQGDDVRRNSSMRRLALSRELDNAVQGQGADPALVDIREIQRYLWRMPMRSRHGKS